MFKLPRKTIMWLAGSSILLLVYNFITDPNGGALTIQMMGQLATPVIVVWMAWLMLQAVFDYVSGQELFEKIGNNPIGLGMVFLGRCIVFFALLGLLGSQLNTARAQDVRTYIPIQAQQHLPTLKQEQTKYWPEHPKATFLQL